ncbi:CPBP family intramembrane glutamic endopeptidase [Halocatena halophila]|uniref:CPBP family intramembrane glutamic endopeptidase n=1 Tax=Halocatena halophila TaxID=2814576 RepID=UPI002ED12F9D
MEDRPSSTDTLIPVEIDDIESGQLEWRRIGCYLVVTFGFSWLVAVVLYLTGGIGLESQQAFSGVKYATILLPLYMFGPAIGVIITRLVTGEGRDRLFVRPRLRSNWRWYLLGWLGPPVLIALGGALYFLLMPSQFDPTFSSLEAFARQVGLPGGSLDPLALLGLLVVGALTIDAAITSIATFGEEFGWRAYLVPKLLALGDRRAIVLSGVIWGVWHWPLTIQGHNYPGTPILGAVLMCYFTIVVGVFLAWIALRGESVWPAVIGHAVINTTTPLVILLDVDMPQYLIGPMITGVVGSIPFALLACWLLLRDGSFALPMSEPTQK